MNPTSLLTTSNSAVVDAVNGWFAACRPKLRQKLSEWSRENARLDDGSTYLAFPFQEGIADAMTDPAVPQVSVKKSSRIGYSQVVKNLLGYAIDQQPVNIIMFHPTVRDAEKYSRKEFNRVVAWPSTRRNVVYGPRDPRNTLRQKEYPGGTILLNGTNSPGEFRADTAEWVLLEEVDGYPTAAGVEGDPVELAFKRAETADEPKRIAGSTPTVKGASRIDALFEAGTQEYRYVPCPHCGMQQRLVFGDGTGPGLRWEPRERPTRAWYRCEAGCDIEEHHKAEMDQGGEWRAHAPENWPHRSFHIWAVYSQFPGAAWLTIAKTFVEVRKDRNRLTVFVNQVLGETFEVRGEAPPWRRLYERREAWDVRYVPRDALVLLGGLDVQKDRVELFVWGWGSDRQSWLVDHVIIVGSPFQTEVWAQVSEAVQRSYRHELGAEMRLLRVGADTGFATTQVERWTRRHAGLVVPVKGAVSLGAPAFAWSAAREAVGKGKRRRGLRVGMVGGHTLTLELYGFLGLDPPTLEEAAVGVVHPAGYVHLAELATEEVCKQLVGDQWVEKSGEWRQAHATEALDGWKYARAMWSALRLDAWPAAKWQQVREMLGHAPRPVFEEEPVEAVRPVAPAVPAVQVVQQQRTVIRSSFVGRLRR